MNSMTIFRQIIPLIIATTVLYFVLVVPQNKRRKEMISMLSSLKVNDEVITTGGIAGKVVNNQDDFVIIQTGPDKVRLKFSKSAIIDIIKKNEEVKKEEIPTIDEK